LQELHPSGAGVGFFARMVVFTDQENFLLPAALFATVAVCCFFTVTSIFRGKIYPSETRYPVFAGVV
jgi:hypothetical protein